MANSSKRNSHKSKRNSHKSKRNSYKRSQSNIQNQFKIDLLKAEADLILKNSEYVKLYDQYRRSGHISIQNFLANIGYYGWELLKMKFVLSFLCRMFGSNI